MPRMPLSGVRNSWLTVARKRDFDPLGAPGAHELWSAAPADHARFHPGQPAHAGLGLDRLIDDPRPFKADAGLTAFDDGRAFLGADQPVRGRAHEIGETLVGEGDAALAVALHDEVEVRLDEAAVALLGFGEPPGAVLQPFNLAFEGDRMLL